MAKVARKSRRRKEKKHIERGAAHIKSTFNNTISQHKWLLKPLQELQWNMV